MEEQETQRAAAQPAPPNQSPTLGALAGALAKAQGSIEGAKKGSTNPHFKSRYADLSEVWDACREALAANEIAVIQLPSADGARVTVRTTLVHSSGEWISSELTMACRDATPQSLGSGITYGRRYGLAAVVGIAPEDDDGQAASRPSSSTPASAPAVPAAPKKKAAAKRRPAEVEDRSREEIVALVREVGVAGDLVSRWVESRYGHRRVQDLEPAQRVALYARLGRVDDEPLEADLEEGAA